MPSGVTADAPTTSVRRASVDAWSLRRRAAPADLRFRLDPELLLAPRLLRLELRDLPLDRPEQALALRETRLDLPLGGRTLGDDLLLAHVRLLAAEPPGPPIRA